MPTYYPPGKRKGNETFVVRGYIGGKQYEIATDAKNKRAAEAAWTDFASETRKEQRDADRDSETATFDWACDEYLEAHPDLGTQFKKNVQRLRSHFAGWFIKAMTVEDIYLAAHKLGAGLKPQSKNYKVITPAAAVLHYMARRRLCDHFVIPMFDAVGVNRPLTYPEQLAPLIEGADKELRAFLLTMQIHGWRVTETCMIKTERIDWKRARIERWVAKSQQWRWAPVDYEVLKAWRGLPERADGFLFQLRNRTQVYRAIDKLIKRLGLKMHYRPHRSRRGLATTLRDLKFSIDDIRDAGQWGNSQSVKPYVQDNPERVRPTFEILRGHIRGRSRKAQ